MKHFNFLPIVAVIAALVLSITMSSFKKNEGKKPLLGTTYFKFNEITSPTEGNLENDAKWEVASLPGSNPCTAGTAAPCIVHVDNTAAGIDAGDNNATRISKFVDYMETLTPLTTGAGTYVSTTGNFDYQRQ